MLCLTLLIVWEVFTKLTLPAIAPGLSKSTAFWISRSSFWLIVLAMGTYAIKVEKSPLLLWQENTLPISQGFLSVIAIMAAIFVGSAIINLAIRLLHLTSSGKIVQSFAGYSWQLRLFTVITAAIGEELLFRAYLMPRIQLWFKSTWPAIIITSVLFGLGHAAYGTISNTIGPLFIGFVFAWYYSKYRNLKVLIICHFLIDFIALFLVNR